MLDALHRVIPCSTGNPNLSLIARARNAMAEAPSPLHIGGLRSAPASFRCSRSEANAQTRLRLKHARLTPSTAQPRHAPLLSAKEARRQRPSHGIAGGGVSRRGLKL